jgi:hypothetical protein
MWRWQACAAGAFFAGLALFATGVAIASDVVVGSVLAVRGEVFLETSGAQRPLLANAPVHLEDTIVSIAGKAKIALDDGTIISVGENSRVRVAEYESKTVDIKTRVRLITGVLRLLVVKVTPAGRFEVETETAIAAVRGTDWVIEATPENTAVALVAGVVAVSSRDGQAQTTVVLDRHGQGTDVRRGSAPAPVAQWGAQRFSSTVARATFE